MNAAAQPGRGRGTRVLLHVLAGLSGAVVLALEFTLFRGFAPVYGSSSYVIATVIAVVLVALALGYWWGGRLGQRAQDLRPLAWIWLGAAAWLAQAGPLASSTGWGLTPLFHPTWDQLGGSLPMAFWGSLASALLVAGPPSVALGMTSPYLIAWQARREGAGRATGSIYAAGTVGSLVATWLVPMVLLQVWGTWFTLFVLVGILIGMGLLLHVVGRRSDGEARSAPGPEALAQEGEPAPAETVGGIWWIAGITGLVVTVIEMGAIRFMAPWFGQSNVIWANVIGVILFAMAIGSWVGGRIAGRGLGFLAAMLLVSAAWLLAAIAFGPGLLDVLAPSEVGSTAMLTVTFSGSLLAGVVGFGPIIFCLSMAPAFLVQAGSLGDAGKAGKAAGVVLGASTLGGLIGILLTPTLGVPLLGSRTLMLLMAALLALVATALISRRGSQALRSPGGHALRLLPGILLGGLAGMLIVLTASKALRTHPGQLEELESGYQVVRVVEGDELIYLPGRHPYLRSPYGRAPMRFLRHDEDPETYQSVWIRPADEAARIELHNAETKRFESQPWPSDPSDDFLTGGRYFESMALGTWMIPQEGSRRIRVLVIGYAGGTIHRIMRRIRPPGSILDVTGIEIDPAVVEIADRWLGHAELRKAVAESDDELRLITGEDARTVVNALPPNERFDLVLVDAYARTNYLPFQLATREFFERIRARLTPRGWIGVNVLGGGARSPVTNSVARTMSVVFPGTWITPNNGYPGNVTLWSPAYGDEGPRLRWALLAPRMIRRVAFDLERLTVRFDVNGPEADGTVVFVDDHAPSDKLADEEFGLWSLWR